jgi:hypothetical protein
LKIAVLALAAVLAAAFGSWFLASQGVAPPAVESPPLAVKPVTTQPVETEAADAAAKRAESVEADPAAMAALEQKAAQVAEFQPFFARLRGLYPTVYEAALKTGAAQGMDRAENAADVFLDGSVQMLRQTRGLNAARAGGQALDRLFDAHRAIVAQLAQSDPTLCVDFLNGASADRFAAFTGAHRALMAEWALAGLEAIEDGAQKKIDREPPSPVDFDDLEKLLETRGLNQPAIELLLDGKTPNPPLSDDQACKNGLVYLDALKSLPDLQRLRLYALALEVTARE